MVSGVFHFRYFAFFGRQASRVTLASLYRLFSCGFVNLQAMSYVRGAIFSQGAILQRLVSREGVRVAVGGGSGYSQSQYHARCRGI